MRGLLTATAATSVLALGLYMEPALSLPIGAKIAGPDPAVQQVQQGERGSGQGMGSRGQSSPGAGGGGRMQGPGGATREDGGAQLRSGGRGMRGEEGGESRSGEKGTRERGGAEFRSGERGTRERGGAEFRSGERGTRERGGVEFRYGERGMRGDRPRVEGRSRTYIERDRDRRRTGRGGVDIEIGPPYGYVASCSWLRRRAMETDSAYWWRRYRACRGW